KMEGGLKGFTASTAHPFKQIIGLFQGYNVGTENVYKVAQYRAALRGGSTKKQASYKGRDIMDYQRSGTATRDLDRIFGFLNPNLQGKSKQLRALKERPISTSIKTLTTGMSLSYLAKWATDNFSSDIQRERIADAPEWLKQTYWLIPGADDEKVIRIPKPYEVSVLASTPTAYMLNRADEANSDFEASLGEWLKQAIFIDPSLNIATPAWEAYTGHDTFTGQDIIPTS